MNEQGNLDIEKSVELLEKAIEFENPEAMFKLGVLFSSGKLHRKQFDRSFELFYDASTKEMEIYGTRQVGVAESKAALGIMYFFGLHVEKNIETSIEYFESTIEYDIPCDYNHHGSIYDKRKNRNIKQII